jgi:hypothetical protein
MELQLAEAVVRAIGTEYLQTAAVKHPPIHSAHEGAAILKEKYDILGRGKEARCRSNARGGGQVGSNCTPLRSRDLPSNRDYR